MANYQLLSEFSDEKDPDAISVTPFWMIAVVRFANPLTFSRKKMFSGETAVSFDTDFDALIRERSMLVLSDDVLQMSISHTKDSYVSSLSASIMGSDLNYLSEIQPNDWLLAWILNDEQQGLALKDKVLKAEACNGFNDGLKFVGRVQGIRKHLQQAPGGTRTVRYQLQGAGFRELDSSIFYDPALSKEEQSIGQFLTEMGISLDDICRDDTQSSGGISTVKVIPRLLKLLVGEGVPPDSTTFGDVQIATGLTATQEAPYSYAIPKTVAKLLGQTKSSKPDVNSYADILELVIGLQKYSGSGTPVNTFTPDGANQSDSNFRILNDNLLGSFQPLPISLNGKSIWSILEEFKNPAVNEMFTALRLNPEGRVVPTIIVRQLPYSTRYALENDDASQLTGLLELPRWVCAPILVNSLDTGKSDAVHANFIHVYGQASQGGGLSPTEQIIQNPPIRDEEDIKRNGLRPHMLTVSCTLSDTLDEPKKWMKIAADFMVGQQYTLNGSINMIGIVAPICPGDGFEFDDTVYHIESVGHNCSISDGQRQFSTGLTLSHGMRSDSQDAASNTTRIQTGGDSLRLTTNPEIDIYTGTRTNDNLRYDPGQSVEDSGKKFSTNSSADQVDPNALPLDAGILT